MSEDKVRVRFQFVDGGDKTFQVSPERLEEVRKGNDHTWFRIDGEYVINLKNVIFYRVLD